MILINIKIAKSDKLNGDNSLFITFPYNADILSVIRSFPSRYWHKDTKQWELPYTKLDVLLTKLNKFEFKVEGEKTKSETSLVELPKDFKFKTKPFKHQIDGVNFGISHNRWILGDEQGLGKALALDTKIYTPNGYKLMKDINVGDYVFGKDGKPTKVLATYNHYNIQMYKITFSDGVSIKCCKDHLWEINTKHGKKVVDTNWFMQKDQFGVYRYTNLKSGGAYKFSIDRCKPVQFNHQTVPLNPYVLGALLGDGGLSNTSVGFTNSDNFIINKINKSLPQGYKLNSSKSMNDIQYNIVHNNNSINIVKKALKDLKLFGKKSKEKFIPTCYLYNDINTRLSVLNGILDTDGYVNKGNNIQITSTSKQLIKDVRFLVESLGGICNITSKIPKIKDKEYSRAYVATIRIDNPEILFTLPRKKKLTSIRTFKPRRNIVKIERIPNADAKCITVDNADHLYLAEHFIVTHNTKQVIDIAIAQKIARGYKHCLIVCGVNGLKWNWCDEIATHSNETAHIIGQKLKNNKLVIGSSKDKLNDILNIENISSYFLITNVESLRNSDIVSELSKLCKNKTIGIVAIDEIHRCKNPSSQQGKGILKLQSECRIAMTGTPLLNTPLDLFIILKWIGYEKHAFYAFKQHYCVMGGYGGYEIIGYKNLNELQETLDSLMLRRLKSDVLDLPDKLYIDEYVEMTPKQAQIYNEITDIIKSNIDLIKTAPNPLAELIRMRQATGYTGILSSTVKESAKLDRLEQLVKDCTDNNKKVVIFSNWTQMTNVVYEKLTADKYNGLVITGDTKDNQRQHNIYTFQNNPKCQFILGTIGAMGTGVTLTAGTVVIFLDEPWTMASKNQAIDRCHRIGTTENITVYTLMCKNTIDERIHDIVLKKGALSDAIVDGKVIANKAELLNYLLS